MLSSKYIYSNYTFWHSKNNNRVGSRTHWINYESNLCPISYYLISRSPYYNRMTRMFFYGLLESVSILNKYPIDPRKSDSLTSTKCIVTFVSIRFIGPSFWRRMGERLTVNLLGSLAKCFLMKTWTSFHLKDSGAANWLMSGNVFRFQDSLLQKFNVPFLSFGNFLVTLIKQKRGRLAVYFTSENTMTT